MPVRLEDARPVILSPSEAWTALRGFLTSIVRDVSPAPPSWASRPVRVAGSPRRRHGFAAWSSEDGRRTTGPIPCPFGVPGTLLWVMEDHVTDPARFRADLPHGGIDDPGGVAWAPGSEMAREAARLFLRVASVSVSADRHCWRWTIGIVPCVLDGARLVRAGRAPALQAMDGRDGQGVRVSQGG